ncbi:unnamed protein product [Adineta steineri]|uniref:G-protein coupled receptors family 1 profile domain-containing protein n=1 Tax=Adineta steineri TaxID=433720 RepID=A0A818U429_9BILA|nr:unnamed protein product [Adineta steineri]CAF3686478.1 unnamed protein product [Adineta steineri]
MNISSEELVNNDKFVLHRVKFIILISLQIPSIIISLLIFIFFITCHTRLNVYQNQAILFLLIVNFFLLSVDLPMPIHFYFLNYVTPATAGFCTWWTFFEYSLNLTSELLMAVISIQRHILIFQPSLLNTRFMRFLLYYFPLLLCLIYPIIFYMAVIIFYPCNGTQWDFKNNLCGYANCYLVYDRILSTFDWGINNGLPIVVIILANIILVIRIIKQKHRHHQHISIRKQRRMALQLLSISSLYLIAWLPSLLIGLGQQLISATFLAQFQLDYALDLIYLVCLLLPWICIRLLPGYTVWMRNQWHHVTVVHNRIRPI